MKKLHQNIQNILIHASLPRQLLSTACAGLAALCPLMVLAAVDDKTSVDSASPITSSSTVFNLDKFYPGAVIPAANCPADEQKVESAAPNATAPNPNFVRASSSEVVASNRIATSQKMDALIVDAKSYDPKKTMLIDIRPAKEIERLRIPDALAIDRAALTSRQFLKQQSLLLLGDDGDDQGTLLLAQQLKSEGFQQVAVSRNGVRGWLAAGMSVQVAPGANEALKNLTALQFHYWNIRPQTKRIWLGSAKNIPVGLNIADVIALPTVSKAENSETAFRRLLAKHLTASTALLVLIPENSDAVQFAETNRWLNDKVVTDSGYRVAIVAEGWLGYRRFLNQQQAIVAQKDMSLQRPCNAL